MNSLGFMLILVDHMETNQLIRNYLIGFCMDSRSAKSVRLYGMVTLTKYDISANKIWL